MNLDLSALLLAGSAAAGSTDARKCEADEALRTGSHASCRMTAHSRFVTSGDAATLASALTKCHPKIMDKFSKAEARWGAERPTTGDVGAIETQVKAGTEDLGVLLSGGALSPVCGNGTVEAGEDCDFGDLAGETCDSQTTSAAPSGALACTPGSCTLVSVALSLPTIEDPSVRQRILRHLGLPTQIPVPTPAPPPPQAGDDLSFDFPPWSSLGSPRARDPCRGGA